jgi:hypothetical protein
MTDVGRRAYERVDLAAGTVRVDLVDVEAQRGRLEDLAESMQAATDAFRTLGLTGPADLVTSWLTDLELTSAWLYERLHEADVARELAGVADARGITLAEAFAQVTGQEAGPAQDAARV